MPTFPKSSLPVLLLGLAIPDVARAQKLDKQDKAFLESVQPIMLTDEEKTFRGLKKKEDRAEFQKIFWARRDPDLETEENEYQEEYLALKAEVDREIKVPGRPGSATDCGRVLILLGKPDEVKQEPASSAPGRLPETWILRNGPKRTFEGGEATIAFDELCRAHADVGEQLNRIAERRIAHPNVGYRMKEGRLTKLVDLLPKPSPAQALLKQPRQDFPVAAQASFLKVSDGGTALLGLIRGDATGLTVTEDGGKKTLKLVVAANALDEAGKPAAFSEETRFAEVAADGSFVASFRMGLKPGKYTLQAGALDEKTGKGALASLPVEAPDLNNGALSMASLLIVRAVDEVPEGAPEDPENPYAAFSLGRARLVPFFGESLSKSEAPSFFYQFYDLKVDPATGKASGVASLSVLKDGKAVVAKAPDQPFDQPVGGTVVGPVPLAKYEPGKYVVQLKVADKVAGTEKVQEVPFQVTP